MGQYMSEIRDINYQQNRLLFRNNIMRIGEMEAFEISKTLKYVTKQVQTPLGVSQVRVPEDDVVIATIFRAGLPFHTGFLNVFDHAGNAFVSAYRAYTDEAHTEVGIHVEYLATPNLDGKTLIIVDPMLATGASIVNCLNGLVNEENIPTKIHIAAVIASKDGIEHIKKCLSNYDITLWIGNIDDELTSQAFIVPGLGDAGDLAFGPKAE